MGWIFIKDKLPEYNEGVLITDGKIVTVAERNREIRGKLNFGCHGFSGYEWEWDFREEEITHWMPLPPFMPLPKT